MRVFKSKRNGSVVKEIKSNDKMMTIELEDGTNKTITLSTLNRWYELMDANPKEEVVVNDLIKEKEEEDKGVEEEVKVPESKPEKSVKADKPKKVKKEKVKKAKAPNYREAADELAAFLEEKIVWYQGVELSRANTNDNFRFAKVDGKNILAYTISKSGITLWLREHILNVIGELDYDAKKHSFPIRLKMTENIPENRQLINRIIEETYTEFKMDIENRKLKKTQKTKKQD